MLVVTSNGKTGYLTVDSLVYEINQLGDSKLLLSKVDEFYFEDSHCGQSQLEDVLNVFTPEKAMTEKQSNPFGYGNCRVRCLILYTSAAAEREGDNLMIKIDKAKK